MGEMPIYMTQADVARFLGVSRQRIGQLVKVGKLVPQAMLVGNSWLFTHEAVTAARAADICMNCGGEYHRSGIDQVYCGAECRREHQRKYRANLQRKRDSMPADYGDLRPAIGQFLAKSGWSQKRLAEASGVVQAEVSNIVRGVGVVPHHRQEMIRRAMAAGISE